MWATLGLNYGRLQAKNIKRSIILGDDNRVEKGNKVKAKNKGIFLMLAYDVPLSVDHQLSPFIKLNWQRFSQGAYQEQGHRSTAMHFSKIKYKQTQLSLGVNNQLTRDSYQLHTSAELILPINKNKITDIQSGLNSTPLSHSRTLNFNSKATLSLGSTLEKQIRKNMNLRLNLNAQVDRNKNMQYNYNVGINIK